MTTISIENVFNIIQFLPFGSQAKICEKTRAMVLPLMANVIKRSMKNNRERMMKLKEDEMDSLEVMRSAQCLYQGLNENQIRDVIETIIRNKKKYSMEVIDIISFGLKSGWTHKKIHRHVIHKLDIAHLVDLGW